jgi:hypothetical protein
VIGRRLRNLAPTPIEPDRKPRRVDEMVQGASGRVNLQTASSWRLTHGKSLQPLSKGEEVDRTVRHPGVGPYGRTQPGRKAPTSCIQGGAPSDPWGSERRAREVVDMVIALWIFAIVACCALCVWGIATAVRRSNERRAHAVRH